MAYIRVTDIIGPKVDMTEVVLEVEMTMDDYLELEDIVTRRGEDVDDMLREALHAYVTTNRARD